LQIIAQNFHSVYPISAIPGNTLEYEVVCSSYTQLLSDNLLSVFSPKATGS